MEEINRIFEKYLNNQCSPQELRKLLDHFRQERQDEALYLLMEDELRKTENEEAVFAHLERMVEHNRSTLRDRIMAEIGLAKPKGKSLARQWLPYAAAILLFLSVGLGLYLYMQHQQPQDPLASKYGDDVLPGGNKAMLTLADGRKIVLDEAANGELAEESGIKITKTEDGQVVYNVAGARIADARQPVMYNTIETPKGGQYKIILPDSSVVWLNAASSLRYPTRFDGEERRVELTGEAYFQIRYKTQDIRHKTVSTQASGDGNKSKIVNHTSKIPFIVATATQEVQVLGTQFNINAYTDESVVKTTLLEGSVRVASTPVQSTNLPIHKSTILLPNEQSILQGNRLSKQTVNAKDFVAWKDGEFVFHYTTLKDIMAQLQRWYDIEIDSAALPDETFYAEVSRSVPLSAVLDMIETTSNVRFEIKGRRLTIR